MESARLADDVSRSRSIAVEIMVSGNQIVLNIAFNNVIHDISLRINFSYILIVSIIEILYISTETMARQSYRS